MYITQHRFTQNEYRAKLPKEDGAMSILGMVIPTRHLKTVKQMKFGENAVATPPALCTNRALKNKTRFPNLKKENINLSLEVFHVQCVITMKLLLSLDYRKAYYCIHEMKIYLFCTIRGSTVLKISIL